MTTENKNTENQVETIALHIRDREKNGLRTYYTLRVKKHGKSTTIAKRKIGEMNFRADISQAIRLCSPHAIRVEIYRGKSRRIREPESFFYLDLRKLNSAETTPVQSISRIVEPLQSDNFLSNVIPPRTSISNLPRRDHPEG
jgi:hypothetical protein